MLKPKTIFLQDVFESTSTLRGALELIPRSSSSICLNCRGAKMLCGKLRCPVLAKAEALVRCEDVFDSDFLAGSSPPAVFVGRIGYPKVYVGPMVPPAHGDTKILDTPELWVGKSIDEIIDYRFSLVRGKARVHVRDVQDEGKLITSLHEMALAKEPVDCEIQFTRKPRKALVLDEGSQPFGPSAPLKTFHPGDGVADRSMEKAYYDHDLLAWDAVVSLYQDGRAVSKIQRSFSLGMFGKAKARKIVPTRWSITAVDTILSLELMDRIREFETIDEYRVYTFTYLDNVYVAILTPDRWRFEWIEAWFPGTAWNEDGASPAIMGDYEPYQGRKTYAQVGGCYYAARLAVCEALNAERRQASALIIREIHPGYILPVGVWNVRESVRSAMKSVPKKFDTLEKALHYGMSHLSIGLEEWASRSVLLDAALRQRKISDYVRG